MTSEFHSYIPKRIIVKDFLNDIRNKYVFTQATKSYDYIFIHPTKCGGTFLRSSLCDILSDYKLYANHHEIKISHLPLHSKILISCRDPIERFESSFYSYFRGIWKLNHNYPKYHRIYNFIIRYGNDINNYLDDLTRSPSVITRQMALKYDFLGRFCSISYWLRSKRHLDRMMSNITLFRVECLNRDLLDFAKNINSSSFDPNRIQKGARPTNLPKIDGKYTEFLYSYLSSDYELVNHLRVAKGFPPYPC